LVVEPKPLFRERFREYVQETLGESFDSQQDVTRSKLMARFFAEKVLYPRNPTLMPFGQEEIESCVVDGKGDQSVDFICREGGVVTIIQAKYSGGKKVSKRPSEDPPDFDSFRNVLSRLHGYRDLEMNQGLREIAAEINWETDRFQLYYITLRQLAADQESLAKQPILPVADVPDLPERAEIYLFDETHLNGELRDTLSLEKNEARPVKLQFTANEGGGPWICLPDENGGRACYVGRISGAQLANLYTEHKSALFTLNIRNYIGDNLTNKTIRKTAIESPAEFFYFNNGISALATRVEPDPTDRTGRTLTCENFSVVNGAQTIRSLHKAHIDKSSEVRNVQVLLRLTEVEAKKTRSQQEFLDNVTKYNNTQNSIRVSDFRSNDKVQYDIKNRFDALPAVEGKKFLYKNKRSGERDAGRIVVGMEEFVKTLYAFMFGPDDVFGGTGYVFDATKEGGYVKLFGDGKELLPSLSKETFDYYAGVWFVCSHLKEGWKEQTAKTKDPALERRWMFYFALGETLRVVYDRKDTLNSDMQRLGDPGWIRKGSGEATKRSLGRCSKLAFKALSDAYKEAENKTGFTHRNWFRSVSTLQSVSAHIESSWDLLSEHAADYFLRKP